MSKILERIKSSKKTKTIVTLLIGMFIGIGMAPTDSEDEKEDIEVQLKEQEKVIKDKEKEIATLSAKVESAKPWFDKSAEEQKAIEEENEKIAAEKKAKEAEEKKKAEEAAAIKAEEERLAKEEAEKNKYDNGPSYNEVARNPDDHLYKLGKYRGEVVQVMEGSTSNTLRVAIDGDYDQMMLVQYDTKLVTQRILEDDDITVYGTNTGIYSYESTMGATISIPSLLADKIDFN